MDHLIDKRLPITVGDIDQAVADARQFLAGQPVPAQNLIERLLAIAEDAYGPEPEAEQEPEDHCRGHGHTASAARLDSR